MPRNDANKENEDPNPSRVKKPASLDESTSRPDNGLPSTKAKTYGKHETMPVLVTDLYKNVELPNLDEFDPSDIKMDATIVAVGKRRTGKTWVFRNLMYLMKDKFKAGIVTIPTPHTRLRHHSPYLSPLFRYPNQAPHGRHRGAMGRGQAEVAWIPRTRAHTHSLTHSLTHTHTHSLTVSPSARIRLRHLGVARTLHKDECLHSYCSVVVSVSICSALWP